MPKKNLIIFSIISIVFFLDFVTKNYAITNLLLNHSEAINTYLNFTLAFNYGAAFSFLSDAGGWQRWFFVIFSIIVVFFISYILVLGGALGNLYDRIFLGYVIDFIEFHYNDFYWPIFNIADIAISIGVILLLYSMFLKDNKKI